MSTIAEWFIGTGSATAEMSILSDFFPSIGMYEFKGPFYQIGRTFQYGNRYWFFFHIPVIKGFISSKQSTGINVCIYF